jgi:hypothetical protein
MVGPAATRDAVTHLKAVMGLSKRRACQSISADRQSIRYRSCRPPEVELSANFANSQMNDGASANVGFSSCFDETEIYRHRARCMVSATQFDHREVEVGTPYETKYRQIVNGLV